MNVNKYTKRNKYYVRKFLNDLKGEENEMDIMVKLSNAPGILYGLDKLINRNKIETILEEKIQDRLAGNDTRQDSDDDDDYQQEHAAQQDHEYRDEQRDEHRDEQRDEQRYEHRNNERNESTYKQFDSSLKVQRRNDFEKYKKLKKRKRNKERQIQDEKTQLLIYLDRLRHKGVNVKKLDTTSDFAEIKFEAAKHRQRRKIEFGKHIFVQILLDIIRIIEFISTKIEIVPINLKGWHRNVRYHLSEYDDVIEEIVEKYSKGGEDSGMSPEAKLGLLLLVSAVDHSASNSGVSAGIGNITQLFSGNDKKKPEPDTDDIDQEILREIEEEKLKK